MTNTPEHDLKNGDRFRQRKEFWDRKVSDPAERKVFEALSDPQWDWRTTETISVDAGLSKDYVGTVLRSNDELVRMWPCLDPRGRELFTLRITPTSFGELVERVRTYISKSYS